MKVKYATIIVENMDKKYYILYRKLNIKIDEEFDLPSGKITLLEGDGDTGIELIENPTFDTGFYYID